MPELTDFATTERQREIGELRKTMSFGNIAKKLGLNKAVVQRHYQALKRNAERRGWSPEHDMTHPAPETHYLKGTSTLYDENGVQKLQWVKTHADTDRLQLFARELAEAVCQDVKPSKPIKAPKRTTKDFLSTYPIGDAHKGLYCWEGDAEENWDLASSQRVTRNAIDQVLEATPASEEALVVNLGDWTHTDDQTNATPRSKHQLDVDTRWPKVLRAAASDLIYITDAALRKHSKVRLINEIGNHDPHTSIMLSMVLEAYYRNNKRVSIDDNASEFHYYHFHNNLFGVNHGHKCKPEGLYRVMAEDQRELWGKCQHRYWFTGHIHHARKIDVGGCVVETFRTLIPRDNYAHSNGYRAPRDICSITFDREYGECSRKIVNVEACR